MKGRTRCHFSALVWVLMALAGPSAIPVSLAHAAGADVGEELVTVPLVVSTKEVIESFGVGGYTFEWSDSGFTFIHSERPGDTGSPLPVIYESQKVQRMGPPRWFFELDAGQGSELRVRSSWHTSALSVSAVGAPRVCFRKAEQGWVYLCGRGEAKYADGTVRMLGDNRTVDSCLELLSSSDPIFREGGARDLGRLTGDADVARVVPRLAALLNDTVPFVRRGAAEGLGLIGRQECVLWLKAAVATEQEEVTGKYIAEALALCGGNVLIGDPNAPDLLVCEAAKLYSEGRTRWADDMLAQRIKGRSPAAVQTLMARLESDDAGERLAAVRLLGAAKCVEARGALTKLSTDDPDEKVKAAAKEALAFAKETMDLPK